MSPLALNPAQREAVEHVDGPILVLAGLIQVAVSRDFLITLGQNPVLSVFALMLLAIFIVPFLAFLYRRIKLSLKALTTVAFIICVGVWINRYLMVIPVFSDGSGYTFLSWTGIALTLGGLSAMLISFFAFLKLFPNVTITTYSEKQDH